MRQRDIHIYPTEAAEKQTQFIRFEYFVMRIAKTNLKKQTQY